MASPSPLATKGERLGEALDLIYDEYEQALELHRGVRRCDLSRRHGYAADVTLVDAVAPRPMLMF